MPPTYPSPSLPHLTPDVLDAVIIGAGSAGIAAARTLSTLTPSSSLLLLEARPRIGGRTLTSTKLGVPVDLGASWIHHYSPANPMVPLTQQVIRQRLGMTKEEGKDEEEKEQETGGLEGREGWDAADVPAMSAALYCGFVTAVEDGKAVSPPSPFPGLGGGSGRFVLFDADGCRIPAELYRQAVAIYNRSMHEADERTTALQLSLPPPPHTRSSSPFDYTPTLAANYLHYSSAVASVDTSISSFIRPIIERHLAAAGVTEVDGPRVRRVLDFLLSGSEQFEGASMEWMSALYWQAGSDGSGAVECDMLVQRGYGEVVRELGRGLDIRLRHVVRRIDYTGEVVRLEVEVEDEEERVVRKEVFHCRYVVVTAPLGVLKRPGLLDFDPPLPPAKLHAIDSFGFGLMNKVVLQFDECWWGEEVISIGWCSETRGLYRWILSLQPALALNKQVLAQHPGHAYPREEVEGSPNVLVCFSTADVGEEVERKSDDVQRDEVMDVLRRCFTRADINASAPSSTPSSSPAVAAPPLLPSPDTVLGTDREMLYSGRLPQLSSIPTPIAYEVTRWGSDRFAYGSYSHYALGCNEMTVEMLAAAVGEGKVSFAGEHTCSSSIGCVDSAYETGIREGHRIAALLQRRNAKA